MQKTHTTIKDLAKALNISPSTVSRALNDHPDINPNTKRLVNDLAQKLDYVPNLLAKGLHVQSFKTIGIIVPKIKHEFFSKVISGAEDVAYDLGYTVMVCQSNEKYEREVVNINALVSKRVAGVMVSVSQSTKKFNHLKKLQTLGIPLVLFDRVVEELNTNMVVADDFNGAFQAVEHLILTGHKKITHFAGPHHLSISQNRLNGYLSALKQYNIPIDENLIIHGGLGKQDGEASFLALEKQGIVPDAIFAVNDPVAIGAYLMIKEKGYRMPNDIALIGFSGDPITSFLNPQISTIAQPALEMGNKAVKLLIREIESNSESEKPLMEVLKTELITRKSTVKN